MEAGGIRTRLFRQTYCAGRLQTLAAGAPVSIYTVARELGHQSDEMVKRIHAHLGATRHRSGVVEYRLEQLGDRSRRLGFVTGSGVGEETNAPAPTEVEAGEDLPEWARRDSNARPLAPEPPEASDGQRASA
jgi:hypothetical protein